MKIIVTKTDLRNWVDSATANWHERTDEDVDTITDALQSLDHPRWGSDWSDFLESCDELSVWLD
jgi:hypothetical protein